MLTAVSGVLEANVYGVSIPDHDGRAGMACLVINDQFNFDNFYNMYYLFHSYLSLSPHINFIKLLPPEQMLNYLPMPDLYLSVFNHKWTLPPLSNIRKLNSKKKDLIQALPLYVIVPFSPFYFTLIDFYPSPRRTPCISGT